MATDVYVDAFNLYCGSLSRAPAPRTQPRCSWGVREFQHLGGQTASFWSCHSVGCWSIPLGRSSRFAGLLCGGFPRVPFVPASALDGRDGIEGLTRPRHVPTS
jgi:hypothetical protein